MNDATLIEMETVFTVSMPGVMGLLYRGTDEGAADDAYQTACDYIDNDTCHEPARACYEVNGQLVASYKSITFDQYHNTSGKNRGW
ncbi:MAG TPA: hypothetical protein VNU68_07210 [Verrucomicrobiae bacterium]|nr:hypothetical protein [Verrucomicrobiae bacterium]